MGVLGGVANAKIQRQPRVEDSGKATFAQISGQPCRSLVVVFEERRIGIDLSMVALSQDQFGLGNIERGVKFRTPRALDAVIGPKNLRAVGGLYRLEGTPAFMRGCK